MEWLKKVTDFIMPIENEEEEFEEEVVVNKSESAARMTEDRKVANGGTVADDGSVSYGGMRYTASASPVYETASSVQQPTRPQFTVHTGKAAQAQPLIIKLYVPRNFEQVTSVADDIKGKRAVLINYDKVDLAEQRRICDFVNGVCYVTNGDARRISSNIVLYVPDGVDAEEAMSMALAH